MIPETYDTTIYIEISPSGNIGLSECEGEGLIDGYVTLGKMLVSVPLDRSEAVMRKIVDSLDEQADKVRAAAEAKLTEIEAKKQEFLALPNLGD